MVKALAVRVCIGLFMLHLASAYAQERKPNEALSTQSRGDVEISLLSVQRTDKWKNPFAMGDVYEAKDGHEWVVFHIRLKTAKSEVTYKKLVAIDRSDREIKSFTNELTALSFSGKPIDQEFEIPFLVVKGTQLTSLQIDDFRFELKSLTR